MSSKNRSKGKRLQSNQGPSGTKKNTDRHRSRIYALQALYQWDITGTSANDLQARARMDNIKKPAEWPFFDEIILGTIAQYQSLDEHYQQFLDRPKEQITPIERTILRIGAFELVNCLETPYQVVLNEAIELAKIFGADESFKYVNSILHQVAQQVRQAEAPIPNAQPISSTD